MNRLRGKTAEILDGKAGAGVYIKGCVFSLQSTMVTICTAQWSLYVPPGLTLKIPRSAHTMYLCVLCGSENKQRLFPYTALTDWFL